MAENQEYEVLKAGAIAGLFKAKGEKVRLSTIDAQTYLAQGKVSLVSVKKIKQKNTGEAK